MTEMTGTKPIEKLGTAVALWGGLAGVLLWVTVVLLRGGFGLLELGFLFGVPVLASSMASIISIALITDTYVTPLLASP